jgi:hypothetical protein
VQAKLVEVTGEADPALLSITRRDAQKFRDRLIDEGSALTTVKRRIVQLLRSCPQRAKLTQTVNPGRGTIVLGITSTLARSRLRPSGT